MAESVHDLLEENQKAAELLIQNLESVDEMVTNIRDNFINRLKFQVFAGSMKHAAEAIQKIEHDVKEWDEQFDALEQTERKQLDQLQTDIGELGEHVEALGNVLQASRQGFMVMLRGLHELFEERDKAAHEHDDDFFGHWSNLHAHHEEKKAHTSAVSMQAFEQMQAMVEGMNTARELHGSAIEKIGHHLEESHDKLQDAFRDLVRLHEEHEEKATETIGNVIYRVSESITTHLAEKAPETLLNSSETFVGTLGEFVEFVTEGQQKLVGGVETLLEKLQEVQEHADEFKPVMAGIHQIR